MRRRNYLTALGTASTISLAGCLDLGGSNEGTITIGELNPITGAASFYGKPMDAGLKVGVEEAGEFEIGGDSYEFDVEANSDECQNQEGINIVRRYIQEDVNFIFGSLCSNVSEATASLIQDSDVTEFINASFTYGISYENDQIYRSTYTSLQQEPAITRMLDNNDYQNIGYLVDRKNPGFVEQSERLEPELESAGYNMEVVQYERGQNDFSSQVQSMKDFGADIVFVGGYVPGIYRSIEQAYELGLEVPMVDLGQGTEGTVEEIVQDPESLENAMMLSAPTTPGLVESGRESAANFQSKAQEMFPDVTFNLLGGANYDTVFMLIRAMQRAETIDDGEAIREELQNLTVDDVVSNVDIPAGDLVQPYLPIGDDETILDDWGQAWFETFVFEWDGYNQVFDSTIEPQEYPAYPDQ